MKTYQKCPFGYINSMNQQTQHTKWYLSSTEKKCGKYFEVATSVALNTDNFPGILCDLPLKTNMLYNMTGFFLVTRNCLQIHLNLPVVTLK